MSFLKISTIKHKADERYEIFYQRVVIHRDYNLLTAASGILHDGVPITDDEEMSPTVKILAVYLWLILTDERLPAHVVRIHAHDYSQSP